ncbi:hypothetical protein Rhe02_00970 [Rhizocola hellebori]|uniref:DUF3754 domain-containing protein n=1 Tax=Rhizocola hellebori TaxID=1392758 RepID=A0A8J3Q292_9ACTN|nr:TMEM143 family protein [Rhizocola hellebori]GIH02030.1 hypothetical protein Rhe02_00970 [Rhizocola hellebori]
MRGEHFIPFRRTDIVSMCADQLPDAEREPFHSFATMLASLLHHRFHARIEALKDAYHPFNPEADTRAVAPLEAKERLAAQQRLEEELAALARAANFTPIDSADLERAFNEHSLLKVRLAADRGAVTKTILFRRGESTRTRTIPTWWGLRRKTVTFTNYARVLVYATFRDAEGLRESEIERLPYRPGSTIIKLFQNVPRDDLEMVLPNVKIRMRRIDKLLIGIPALVSGIVVIVTKLLASGWLLLLLLAFWLGLREEPVVLNKTGLISVAIGLIAFGAYVVRQVTNFKNRKILFMKALSENLYFRNLDNDAGVFHHLLDAAEEAEVTEVLLAYHFLRTADGPQAGRDVAELDRRIEEFFAQRWDTQVDFEVEDGLRKLRDLALVSEDAEGGLRALPLDEAQEHLHRVWDDLFVSAQPTPQR